MLPPLRYPAGWHEIETAVDAVDLQHQLAALCAASQRALPDVPDVPLRWKIVIEAVSSFVIPTDQLEEMTAAEILETALASLTETLDAGGWDEQGASIVVIDVNRGESYLFDVRDPINPEKL